MRRALAATAAALLGPLALPASSDAATCADVRGTTLSSTSTTKVVRLASRDSMGANPVVGCARPAGRLYTLGAIGGDDDARFRTVKAAGRFVLFASYTGCPACENIDRRVVADLRTGRRRELWRFALVEGDCDVDGQAGGPYIGAPRRLLLGANGVAAGVFVPGRDTTCLSAGYKTRTVVRVSAPGRRVVEADKAPVKEIPSRSLRLRGNVVSWIRAGERRTFAAG